MTDNKAGQRIYDITHEGKITAYTYDETSRLIRAEYPAHSGKEETDLSALFEAGVRPRGYTRR